IRVFHVTGDQTCALHILHEWHRLAIGNSQCSPEPALGREAGAARQVAPPEPCPALCCWTTNPFPATGARNNAPGRSLGQPVHNNIGRALRSARETSASAA